MNLGNGNLSGTWFNIKMSTYQYRKSHCGDEMILQRSYVLNGISYTGKMTSLYWISPLVCGSHTCDHVLEFGIPMGSFFCFVFTNLVSVWVQIFRLVDTPLPISRGRHTPPGFYIDSQIKHFFQKMSSHCYHKLCLIGTRNLSVHYSMA